MKRIIIYGLCLLCTGCHCLPAIIWDLEQAEALMQDAEKRANEGPEKKSEIRSK